MQRVPNLLIRLLSLALIPAVFGFLQVALSQDSGSTPNIGHQEDPAHQRDTSKEPVPPVQSLVPAQKADRIETNSSALVLGPDDELEVTVYGRQIFRDITGRAPTGISRYR